MFDYPASFWIWLVLGGALLIAEVLLVPSGFSLCVGTAACVVGITTFFFPGISLVWELSLFALLSVVSCYAWWTILRKKRGGVDHADQGVLNVKTRQLVGYRAVLAEGLKNGRGRLNVNDSSWPVEADADYPAGTRVEVTEMKGITLKIKAVE